MKIRLLGWDSERLRSPDMKIRFGTKTSLPRVTLLQMPNGTGKTTTLSLLKAALVGNAETWPRDRVLEYAPREKVPSDGRFTVYLLLDDHPLTIEVTLNFLDGGVTYRTTSPAAGGVRDGWHPPSEVRRFLTERFVSLFVFDGELAHRMLDPTQQRAEEAIDALCQLDLLDRVAEAAEVSWERATKGGGARTETGLSGVKNREKLLDTRLKGLRKSHRLAKEKLVVVEKTLAGFDKSLTEQIANDEKNRTALEQAKLEQAAKESALDKANTAFMAVLRHPQELAKPFRGALLSLKSGMDRAKLPDSTSKQFFVELAEEKNCVCGRPIGPEERQVILKQSGRYLGEDISGVLNSLKQDVELLVGTQDDEAPHVSGALETLGTAEDAFHKATTRRQGLEEKLIGEAGAEAKLLQKKMLEAQEEKRKLDALLEEMERSPIATDDEQRSICIKFIERQLAVTRKRISEITGTVDLRKRTDVIKAIVRTAKDRARNHLRTVLVAECNRRLEKILAASPVSVKSIEASITLQGQRQASVGQTLAVGYTFLTSVLGRGAHQFPLVVDSPAGPLDDGVRTEIGAMIPKLCEQFVAFTINTERHHFVPALEKAAPGSVRHLTLYRKTPGTSRLQASLPSKGVTESQNGVLVDDKKFFDQFAVATEAEA
jgi:DNA sulfur modification protein DndD